MLVSNLIPFDLESDDGAYLFARVNVNMALEFPTSFPFQKLLLFNVIGNLPALHLDTGQYKASI